MSLKCVEYCSRIATDLRETEIDALVDYSAAKNARHGVTGWLVCEDGVFIQLIEGKREDVAALWSAIASDPRHRQVLLLRDEAIPDRRFAGWSRRRLAPTAASPGPSPVDRACEALAAQLANGGLRGNRLGDLIVAGAAGSVLELLRIPPSQNRSVRTIDGLLDAAEAWVAINGVHDSMRLKDLVSGAVISEQVAYRYFTDAEAVIRAAVRRRQASALEMMVAILRAGRFRTLAELSAFIVAMHLHSDAAWPPMPPAVKMDILRRYHDLPYQAAWEACARIGKGQGAALLATSPQALATAVLAVEASIKTIMLSEPSRLSIPEVRAMLAELALAALGGAEPSQTPPRESQAVARA